MVPNSVAGAHDRRIGWQSSGAKRRVPTPAVTWALQCQLGAFVLSRTFTKNVATAATKTRPDEAHRSKDMRLIISHEPADAHCVT